MKAEVLNELVTLYEGDCLEALTSMEPNSVDAVITDPPYSDRTHKGHDIVSNKSGAGYDGARRKSLGYAAWGDTEIQRYVPLMCKASSGWVVIMTDHTLAPSIAKAMEQTGRYVFAPLPFYMPGSRVRLSGDGPSSWTDWIIVSRTTKQRTWGTLPGGYTGSGSEWHDKYHMGGKPLALKRALVSDYSRIGQTVLDPFAGSGTTGVAAMLEGRKCILIEKDPKFCDVIRKRIDEASGTGKRSLFQQSVISFDFELHEAATA